MTSRSLRHGLALNSAHTEASTRSTLRVWSSRSSVEQAVEHAAQLDLLFLGELVAGAHQAVPCQAQLGVRVDEILEDIGHVPGDAQPHFHGAGHTPELLLKGALIPNQDSADGVRAGGDRAEGHGQRGGRGHQRLEHGLVGGQIGALRPHLGAGQAAHHGGHAALGDGVHVAAIDTQRWIGLVSTRGHDAYR